jgi:succinyl-diaminopimelate desuccinylase
LDVIEAYEQEIGKRMHPLLPAGSCTPTVIRAGVKENAVPDSCEIWFDRRMIPGETVEVEVADLGARLERLKVADPDFDFDLDHAEYFFAPAEVSPDSELASRFLEAHRQVTGRDTVIYGTPYSSDVRNLVNDAGMEAITFGAGNVAECHCSNERISLEQLRDAALVTAKVATEFLT